MRSNSFGLPELGCGCGMNAVLSSIGVNFGLKTPFPHALSGILIANISHLLSTLVLYKTTLLVFKTPVDKAKAMAFLTACLHILSPAGLFLSAPYSESLFSLLSFTGTFLYLWSGQKLDGGSIFRSNTVTLASAVIFSASCMVRSNGLLNGLLFLHDFVLQIAGMIIGAKREPKNLLMKLLRIGVLGAGGLVIGAGIAAPQVIAWRDYCTEGNNRPWCSKAIPSIYFWVQGHYWYANSDLSFAAEYPTVYTYLPYQERGHVSLLDIAEYTTILAGSPNAGDHGRFWYVGSWYQRYGG